jgi:phospholipase C
LVAGLLAACDSSARREIADIPQPPPLNASTDLPRSPPPKGIHKIQHVIIIMQENRSFDHYFGTFPGAVGLPRRHGRFTVCSPDPVTGCSVRLFHDRRQINTGGPHSHQAFVRSYNHGKMNGFQRALRLVTTRCRNPNDPSCRFLGRPDVMGYHTAREIPNYWAYARAFGLQDHFYEQISSWSLPQHLFLVSGRSTKCTSKAPMSCRNSLRYPDSPGLPSRVPLVVSARGVAL